jgi:fumarate hydratase subunit beta
MHHELTVPISEEAVRALRTGDTVSLNGVIATARDTAHKYMIENFVKGDAPAAEQDMHEILKALLKEGVIYHCGPVVRQDDGGAWRFVAAGPTTSIREEPYQADVIGYFGMRAVIGKGGMGDKTLQACREHGAVYLHAIGGAATYIAESVKEVVAVHKMEFGVPEAFWVIRVEGFPAVVSMDSHGSSIHKDLLEASGKKLKEVIYG